MNAVFALAFVGIFLMVSLGTEGKRPCWVGETGPTRDMKQMQCVGSCVKRQYGEYMKYGCWWSDIPTGCRMVYSLRVCFCNEPLCNTGEMPKNNRRVDLDRSKTMLDWFNVEETGDVY